MTSRSRPDRPAASAPAGRHRAEPGPSGSAGPRTVSKRLLILLALAPTLLMLVAPPFIQPAGAQDDSGPTFSATATADGVDAIISNDSLPLGINPEVAGPTTQASLTSLGDSSALSSFPYPGATVAGVPGLAGALFGGLPVPAYPLAVASDSSTPNVQSGVPGIELDAQSASGLAEATATVGTQSVGFTSSAEVQQNSDESVTSSAQTTMGLNLLDLVSISGVNSQASVTADGTSGQLTRTSALSIGQISVAGLSVTLPPTTPGTIPIPIPVPGLPQLPPLTLPVLPIPLGGTTLPIPDLGFENGTFTVTLPVLGNAVKFAIPAGPVLAAFKALGINLTYQTAQQTSTGVIAPALTFSFTAPALPQNNYYNGTTGISFTLGQSTASVTLHPILDSGGSGGGTTLPSTGVGSTAPVGSTSTTGGSGSVTTTATGTGSPAGTGTLPTGGGSTTPLAGGSPTGATTGSTGSPSATTTAPSLHPAALVDLSQADLSGLYLAAVFVAAVALAAASVLRLLGVRLLWGS